MELLLGWLVKLLSTLGWLEWLLIGMLAFALFVIFYAHRDDASSFNLEHLVVDPSTGSIVLEKFTMFGAFIISSWGFVALIVKGAMTEWYFIGYMAAWAATRGFTGWFSSKKAQSNASPPQ